MILLNIYYLLTMLKYLTIFLIFEILFKNFLVSLKILGSFVIEKIMRDEKFFTLIQSEIDSVLSKTKRKISPFKGSDLDVAFLAQESFKKLATKLKVPEWLYDRLETKYMKIIMFEWYRHVEQERKSFYTNVIDVDCYPVEKSGSKEKVWGRIFSFE